MKNRKPQKIRVLHLINSFSLCGAEKLVFDIVKKMDKSKFKLFVCSVGKGNKDFEEEIIQDLNKASITTFCLNKPYKKERLKTILKLRKILMENKIDIINTHCPSPDFLGRLAAKIVGLNQVFSTIHSTRGYFKTREGIFKYITKQYIAISSEVSKYISEVVAIPDEKISIVSNGIIIEEYIKPLKERDEIIKSLGLPKDRIIITNVGRVVESKGHMLILEAAKILIHKYPKILFVFVGDETHEPEHVKKLKEYIEKEKLNNYFIFMGIQKDIVKILHVSDIFLFPSLFEGFSLSILEAMAMGVPVIASDVGSIREVLEHQKSGIIIKPADIDEISRALMSMLDNMENSKKMGLIAQKNVLRNFSMGKTAKAYETLYLTR